MVLIQILKRVLQKRQVLLKELMNKLLKKTGGITITEIQKMKTDEIRRKKKFVSESSLIRMYLLYEGVLGRQQAIKRLNLTLSQNSCEQ